jgi:uncharacterized membrane protein YhaH (DUF805 family)
MGFIDAIAACLRRTFDYKGRSRRAEYWWYSLVVGPVRALAIGFDNVGDDTFALVALFLWLAYFVLLVPHIAVAVRRLHDVNMRGWWLLVLLSAPVAALALPSAGNSGELWQNGIRFLYLIAGLWLLILFSMKGTEGDNRFGRDPLGTNKDVLAIFD